MIKRILALIALTLSLAGIVFYTGYVYEDLAQAWTYLDRFGLFLGIISFVPLLYAVWQYIKFTRMEENERQRIHRESGNKPAVFIVSIGGASIKNDVEAFLKNVDGFKEGFDFKERIFEVHWDKQTIESSDVNDLIQDVEEKQNEIRIKSADKIHLFMKVPIPIAVMMGEVLANQIPTLIYHRQRNKGYENWGALHR